MGDQLAQPWAGGLVLPFAVALLGALLLGRLHARVGPRIMGAGLALGFLAAFVLLAGGIPFRQSLPHHAVGEVAVLALGCGLLAGVVGLGGRTLQIATAAATLAAVIHNTGGLPSRTALESSRTVAMLLVAAGSTVAAFRLSRPARSPVLPLSSLLAASAGLAAITGFGRALLLAQLTEALAAAAFALLLLCWPKPRLAMGAAFLVPGAAVLAALVQSSLTNAASSPWATLLLPLCFFPNEIAARLGPRKGKPGMARLLLCAALPAVLAAALGWYLARR